MKEQRIKGTGRAGVHTYSVMILLLILVGCDNATSPNQNLTSSYDTPITMQSGDEINSTINELPIYTAEGFYFLAPMVKDSEFSGTFDAGLSPVVEICKTTACDELHASFDMFEDGSEQVRVEEDDEHYIVNWNTNSSGAEAGQTYRIRVMVAGTTLAHADVAVVTTGREAIEVRSDGLIALVANQTLPIKFRAEEGAVYVIGSGGGAITSEDGLVTLEIPENVIDGSIGITISSVIDDFDDVDVVPGTLFDFGPSPFTFNEPVMLTITFDPANLPDGVSEDELKLLAVVDGEWVQLPGSSVDVLNSTVTGPINSFSRKGVGRGKVSEIVVTPADASIEVGDTQQFEATITNVDGEEMNRNVRWSSSDEEVATIDNSGFATALALGESTIEARLGKVTGTADLTVEVAGPVVTTITVSPADAAIAEGSTAQFTATVYDQNEEVLDGETVIWTSSHESVATVNENGLAAGLNEGETTIIATIGAIYGNAILTVAGQDNNAFVTTWDTALGSNSTTVTLGLAGNVDAKIDWGDGTITVVKTPGPHTHDYGVDGVYSVSITGTVTEFNSSNIWDISKLISVDSWGDLGFTSMRAAFYRADNLNSVPNNSKGLENVTDMSFMFYEASNFNGDINGWNTSNVIDMSNMFDGARLFKGDISSWNTGNVIRMNSMFKRARNFNQELGGWDTRNVTDMNSMFQFAWKFNQDLGDWDVSNVTDMSNMFQRAYDFNGDISGWNTSSVIDMRIMFAGTRKFNQNIGGWNTSNVINMSAMFSESTFNGDLSDWDTGNVTNMDAMFLRAWNFNRDIGGWNTSSVTSMGSMFTQTRYFNKDISGWDVGNVTNMRSMFRGAEAFNGDIGAWNTSSVMFMNGMFQGAGAFNGDIGDWNTSKVINMREMFRLATTFDQYIGDWNTSSVRDMVLMFRDARAFNQDLSRWCVSLIPEKPASFDTGATSWTLPDSRPDWGTCPE